MLKKKETRETLLEAALKAAEDVIGWYESEGDRSCYNEEDVPEELCELEEKLKKAKKRLSSLTAEKCRMMRG